MALSSFTPSVTGMSAQAHALETVSTKMANMRTIGYKPNETMFSTLLGSTPNYSNTVDQLSSNRVNINGVNIDKFNARRKMLLCGFKPLFFPLLVLAVIHISLLVPFAFYA